MAMRAICPIWLVALLVVPGSVAVRVVCFIVTLVLAYVNWFVFKL